MPEGLLNSMADKVSSKEDAAILAYDAVNGPHPGHLIAPAGRRGGDGNDLHSRPLQPLKGLIGLCGEAALIGEGLVHVSQNETNASKY